MIDGALLNISLVIGIAALLALVARAIKQPPIIAYLITGIIVGPLVFGFIGPSQPFSDLVEIFAHIGVALLLFIVGLSLDFRVLKELGIVSAFAGIGEIAITAIIGLLIALAIGFGMTSALYIATALAFSSTVVVVKILSDKKEIDTLHGKIALGILIVEDFVAAIALMIIPLINQGGDLSAILIKVITAVILIGVVFFVSSFGMPKFLNYLARNQETLFLFGIGWALAFATLFDYLGFSIEIGALVAGMSLASSRYTLELGNKMKPLRDFFVVLFFVFFGSKLAGTINWEMIKTALILSAFVIIGKPIIVMSVLRTFGYKKRTNFLAGISMAQISEFSLILALLGYSLGHIPQEVMSIAVLIAVITIGISSYSIYYSHTIFNRVAHLLNIFEGKRKISSIRSKEKPEIILLGYHRIGYKIGEELKKLKVPFVIVDNNPKVILSLTRQKIDCIYGDAGDKNSLHEMEIGNAKLIISTIPDISANMAIREVLEESDSKAIFMATAEQPRYALELYEKGTDYVIIPHHLGGDYAAHMIEKHRLNAEEYKKIGKQHYTKLKKGKESSSFS